VFETTTAGGVVFHAAAGLDALTIAAVQACARRHLLRVFVRRGLLPDEGAMGTRRRFPRRCVGAHRGRRSRPARSVAAPACGTSIDSVAAAR